MPMPPPKPSTETGRDRHVEHELRQVTRAVAANGPISPVDLAVLVGAAYWEPGRFDRALAFAVADGLVHRAPGGRVAAS